MVSLSCQPESVHLQDDSIHVWCATLSKYASQASHLETLLSPAEQMRAANFRMSKARQDYVLGRSMLRLVLSRYVEQPPAEITFAYGQFGKPEVKSELTQNAVNFSASYSGDLALYAVTRRASIGVDVEAIRPVPNYEEIAARFFAVRETETLLALSPECRLESFFACWTRKEAFLKATGEGIGNGLADVEVTLTPWEEAGIVCVPTQAAAGPEWRLKSFSPAPGYVAAVAFR